MSCDIRVIPFRSGGRVIASGILVATILIAPACGPAADSEPPQPSAAATDVGSAAQARLESRPVAVLPDGFEIHLELAITPDELAQGLMFRPKLPDDHGMLLIFAEERRPNIWMMNTLVALDLVYLDRAGTIVDVVPDAQPCPAEPCPRFAPKHPAQAVLEIPAGSASRHGVVVGAALGFSNVTGFPAEE